MELLDQIQSLKSQLAEVTAERDRFKNKIVKDIVEIDRLKSELERERPFFDEALLVIKDRDAWKYKAERLAEACRKHKDMNHPPRPCDICETLADFPSPSASGVRDEEGKF